MRYAIGIDIGATKIKGILANSVGRISIYCEVPTQPKRSRAAILSDIVQITNRLKREAELPHFKLEGIGIGIPGIIKSGKLIFGGGTLKQLIGLDLTKSIQKKTGSKVFADNDSKCFTLAESYFGAGRKYSRVAGVTWGTGIGSGFVDKKAKIAKSVEIGHIIVEPNAKLEFKCGCGERGCAENFASGKNIVRRYYAKGGKMKNADVKEIYRSKEKIAKEVLEDAYRYLGIAVAALIRATHPEIVVIGGGVSNLPQPARKKLSHYIYRYADKSSFKIVKSRIGNFSGALGAASLVFPRK